jgi:hypothetical protein
MKKFKLFAQITKVDEVKREVSGLATAEVVDKVGEMFDYETSVPYFKEWSQEIAKATDGKSLGNVREMHKDSAVGKLVDIEFDDANKAIPITAKIVDEDAWQKCLQGVYTGFSIGGEFVKRWKDADAKAIRFTAKPYEISVVDNPCVPDAHFTAVKADGSQEMRKFQKSMYSVSDLAGVLNMAAYIAESLEDEAEWEGDDSPIPAQLKEWISEGVDILNDLTDEESAELLADLAADKALKAKEVVKTSAQPKPQEGEHSMKDEEILAKFAAVEAEAAENKKMIKTLQDENTKLAADLKKSTDELEQVAKTIEEVLAEPEEVKVIANAAVVSKADDSKKGEKKELKGIELTKELLKPENAKHVRAGTQF